ncbi:MAG: hypothetical protein M1536_01830 [Firmicutes bacterium]|nr:hypothetical protein [Bacillota bacterium]
MLEDASISTASTSGIFQPGGRISEVLENYENRGCQIKMADSVQRSLLEDKIAIIEAGTGTGKSLAYLIPSVLHAWESQEPVIISTRTINLQEQLFYKDIPAVRDILETPFTASILRGWRNYICLRKFQNFHKSQDRILTKDEYRDFQAISLWLNSSKDGARTELDFEPTETLWSRLCAESEACLFSKCHFYQPCYFFNARREAAKSLVLVINHALLLSDWKIRQLDPDSPSFIIPPYSRLVIDEAHHLEDVATDFLGKEVSSWEFYHLINQLYKKDGKDTGGFLALLHSKINNSRIPSSEKQHLRAFIEDPVITGMFSLKEIGSDFFTELFQWITESFKKEDKIRLKNNIYEKKEWLFIKEKGIKLLKALDEISNHLKTLGSLMAGIPSIDIEDIEGLRVDINSHILKAVKISDCLSFIIGEPDESFIYWVEAERQSSTRYCRLQASPLNVSEQLKIFFENLNSVILTSATLSINKNFEFLKSRLGIDQIEGERILENLLPSPFNFKENVMICLPADSPYPDSGDYLKDIMPKVSELMEFTEGRAFLLFTSYKMLEEASSILQEHNFENAELLVQGDAPRHRLLQKFKTGGKGILLGTDSFWEGVDVPGKALECVIVMKLPFRVPTDPIVEARIEDLEKKGHNSFRKYMLPLAILKFKQGFGRLIRTKTDRGVILVFDKRIIEKNYGKWFINSMPQCAVAAGRWNEVFERIKKFLG